MNWEEMELPEYIENINNMKADIKELLRGVYNLGIKNIEVKGDKIVVFLKGKS